jgi:hypothetical protein
VADAFVRAMRQVPAFDRIVFAVLDRVAGTPTLRAFSEAMARV